MFDQFAEQLNGNGIAEAGRGFAPPTIERRQRRQGRCSVHNLRVAAAAPVATLEYSDCVSRNYSSPKSHLQTPPIEQARTCSTQASDVHAPRARARRPVSLDANTVLNGRRRSRPTPGPENFPECFAVLSADECFGWPR
jgi:hypothetical protein